MIKDRPHQLETISEYSGFKARLFSFDWSPLSRVLKYDLLSLVGFQPPTKEYAEAVDGETFEVPSEKEIEFFERKGAKIQLVQKVISVYYISETNSETKLLPYAISLFPVSKRGKPHIISAKEVQSIANFSFEENIYYGFNPFNLSYQFYGPARNFVTNGKIDIETDMLGFIDGAFFLVTDFEDEDHLLPIHFNSEILNKRFKRFRKRRYFKKFDSVMPRRVWGVDSPIELFLLQAFATEKIYPKLQTLVYKDGTMMPSLYHVYEEEKVLPSPELVTEIDFYFPEENLAVFCDSSFHRGIKKKNKDDRIDEKLQQIGIQSYRVSGTDIMQDPFRVMEEILKRL